MEIRRQARVCYLGSGVVITHILGTQDQKERKSQTDR